LKIIWRKVLSDIWRAALAPLDVVRQTVDERALAKCPAFWGEHAEPDKMIVGRETGSARHAGGTCAAGAT
jgi:hypothetical protein